MSDDWDFPPDDSGDGFGFDAFDQATQVLSGLIPDGTEANLRCIGADMNKPDKGPGCWFKFQVVGGPFDGWTFYQSYSMKTDAAKSFLKRQMGVLGKYASIEGEFKHPAQMLDHSVSARVKVREYNGKKSNEIADYLGPPK